MTAAQRQARLFYARERRRSLVDTPRLFRTHLIPIGDTHPQGLPAGRLIQPVTFKTKIDLSVAEGFGDLISLAIGLVVSRPDPTTLVISVRGATVLRQTTPTAGKWTIIFAALPGNQRNRTWNQFGLITEGAAALGQSDYGDGDQPIVVSDSRILIEGLSIYVDQIPRHFTRFQFQPTPADEIFALIVDGSTPISEELYALGVF